MSRFIMPLKRMIVFILVIGLITWGDSLFAQAKDDNTHVADKQTCVPIKAKAAEHVVTLTMKCGNVEATTNDGPTVARFINNKLDPITCDVLKSGNADCKISKEDAKK